MDSVVIHSGFLFPFDAYQVHLEMHCFDTNRWTTGKLGTAVAWTVVQGVTEARHEITEIMVA